MNAKHSLCTISMVVTLLCFAGEIKAQSRYERVLLDNLGKDGVGGSGIRMGSAGAAEAVHNGAGLAVDAALDFFTVNRAVALLKRGALLK